MSFGKTNPTDPTNPTMGENFGSSHESSSSSSSSWRDPQSVWGGQAPFLTGLYQRGADMFRPNGNVPGQWRGNQMYNQAAGGIESMMNPQLNPQMAAYGEAIGRNFERNVLPGIQDNAAGFGQMGGSRQGVAEGIAAGEARQQMQDFGAQLYNQDRDRMMQAMAMAPMLGQFGMSVPWYGMQQYAGLLGRPTVLGGAAGSESSSSSSGSSSSYGYNYGGGGGGGGGGFEVDAGPLI